MDRTKFFQQVTVDGVRELDFLYNSISNLTARRRPGHYRMSVIDRKRPDITSYRNYGTPAFWWMILAFNGIQDPFFETTVGRVVQIPTWPDIYDFVKDFKLR
jgi:hypothetical protein